MLHIMYISCPFSKQGIMLSTPLVTLSTTVVDVIELDNCVICKSDISVPCNSFCMTLGKSLMLVVFCEMSQDQGSDHILMH